MSQHDNTNTIVLFQNDVGDNPKRPQYRGKANVNGTEYSVSCWLTTKKDGSGEQYLRGKIEPWKGAGQAPRTGGAPTPFPTKAAETPLPARRAEEQAANDDVPY